MRVAKLDTPALCVDLDVLEKNLTNLQEACWPREKPVKDGEITR